MEKTASQGTIGEIVAADFRTAKVFEKYKIDFCCGGNVALDSACEKTGINLAAISKELEAVKKSPMDRSQNYAAWELPFLADYIINTHHTYLKENTEQIAAYASKISTVHGPHHPEMIEISKNFDKIATDMAAHLREEEEVFFPAIKRVYAAKKSGSRPLATDLETLKTSFTKLDEEHVLIGDATHAIRHLTNEYVVPADVCNTVMVTYQKLKEFEDDLHKHVHLENNILFLKATLL